MQQFVLNWKRKKAMDVPIAVYDKKTKTVYRINSDGTKEIIGERLRKGRYSERIAKKA